MGLLNSTIRVRMLASQKFDLEYRLTLITQSLSTLGNSIADLQTTGNDYTDPNSIEVKKLNTHIARLQLIEKRLNAQKDQYQTKLQMIEQELQSAKEMRQKAIESEFKY